MWVRIKKKTTDLLIAIDQKTVYTSMFLFTKLFKKGLFSWLNFTLWTPNSLHS